jgi:hypothetical protein
MARINNSELNNEITDATRIQSGSSAIPNELGNTVIPVIDVSPARNKITTILKTGSVTASGNSTIVTLDGDKDFYLTGVAISFAQDATCDAASGNAVSIVGTLDADLTSKALLQLSAITLTAANGSIALSFPGSIRMLKGSAITLTGNTFTVGSKVRSCELFGFYKQTTNVR